NEIETTATRLLAEKIGVDRVYFGDMHPEGGWGVIRSEYNRGHRPTMIGLHLFADDVEMVKSLETGRPIVFNDVQTSHTLTPRSRTSYARLGIHALVIIPLIKNGLLIWCLCMSAERQRIWTPQEIALLRETGTRSW